MDLGRIVEVAVALVANPEDLEDVQGHVELEDLDLKTEKCMKPPAINVESNVASLSGQVVANLSIAVIVSEVMAETREEMNQDKALLQDLKGLFKQMESLRNNSNS